MNLIILGPPGSGKGTQSDFLINKYHFVHLSTGDLLRDEIIKASEIGLLAKNYIDSGIYVPDNIINDIIATKLQKQKHYIFDGYPRTITQVKFLEATLSKLHQKIDLVIYLELDETTIKTRLLSRLYCFTCKRTYNKLFLPPKVANNCDYDQTKLIVRTDDSDIAKIKIRLREYHEMTKPLIAYFKNQKNLVVINANNTNAIIQSQIIAILGEKWHDNN